MFLICHAESQKKMNQKQVEEVLKAIIAGKYSWACVLMLRYNGYEPVDYIPYRTYIRLLKENYQLERQKSNYARTGT
ncbi:MAG: HetP family heterocyst commitment protein [Mastigocoleus sp. MO_167.B18]|uniref:HetP family heterocyst commitment protein n=1 Tax=Mastigocoleus sp. MO_188.B34 TaxID=3036635 RepID=UPI002629D41A|nr:HetP family heterocyst commitment protein [Mastigocoleus sp. MO_188.B34]MDJ0693254.1 HetP family heterocyst commitment protein [Mastigocoleus sp. MO_188.B34]MDJ0773354.1 HetP family heterocyst commitment protein [Mastigocoleus sp. MO_167.B18]